MCGIFSAVTNKEFSSQFILEANSILKEDKRRGPDYSQGLFINDAVFFGSNRLQIIGNNDKRCTMPFFSQCKNYSIVFNGEIYNYKDLQKKLKLLGYEFSTNTDTEVILLAYKHWGKKFITKLNGIFTFIIFDKEKNTIFTARDRFGAKPLYYYKTENYIIFHSSFLHLKQFIPSEKLQIDNQALTSYMMCSFIPGSKTIFQNIYKIQPAESLEVDILTLSITKNIYWKPKINIQPFSQKKFNKKLSEAIKKTSISDVGLGVLLSGGIDSSTIVSILSKNNIKTYSCKFDISKNFKSIDTSKITNGTPDETEKAVAIARHFNVQNEVINIKSSIDNNMFDNLQNALGEPIAVPNALGLYLFARELKGKYKVFVTGTGADELLGGYGDLYTQKGKTQILTNSDLLTIVSDFDRGAIQGLNFLQNEYQDKSYIEKHLDITMEKFPFGLENEDLNKILFFELGFALPNWELEMADKLFMDNSMELRGSFLENNFLDYCLTIPSQYKNEKNLLKNAMKGILPDEIINQRKVPSLSTPIEIIKQEFFQEILYKLKTNPLYFFDKKIIERYLNTDDVSFSVLYRIVYLQNWMEKFGNKNYQHILVINER